MPTWVLDTHQACLDMIDPSQYKGTSSSQLSVESL